MAANNPRWLPKKCQPNFFQILDHKQTENPHWQKSTQNFHSMTQGRTLICQKNFHLNEWLLKKRANLTDGL